MSVKKGARIGFIVGVCLSFLSIVLIWIAPLFRTGEGFGDIVAVLLPILPGLLVVNFFVRLLGGEISFWFYVVGHVFNILIFTLIGALIGRIARKKRTR